MESKLLSTMVVSYKVASVSKIEQTKENLKTFLRMPVCFFFFFFSPWDTKWGRWWPPSCWWWLNIVPSITSVEMSALWQYWKGISVHWDGGFDSGRVRQLASLVFRKAGARSKPFIYHWKRFLFFCWALDLADTFFSEWESKLFVDTVICFLPDKPLLFSSSVPCKKFSEVYKICLWISEITFWFD